MNQIELLQGEIAGLSARMKRLEVINESRGLTSQDTLEAERVAQTLGFNVEIIYLPRGAGTKTHAKQRRELARKLHTDKKWNSERIARALGCWERTVWRWVRAAQAK